MSNRHPADRPCIPLSSRPTRPQTFVRPLFSSAVACPTACACGCGSAVHIAKTVRRRSGRDRGRSSAAYRFPRPACRNTFLRRSRGFPPRRRRRAYTYTRRRGLLPSASIKVFHAPDSCRFDEGSFQARTNSSVLRRCCPEQHEARSQGGVEAASSQMDFAGNN